MDSSTSFAPSRAAASLRQSLPRLATHALAGAAMGLLVYLLR
jgi:hypothetical protein